MYEYWHNLFYDQTTFVATLVCIGIAAFCVLLGFVIAMTPSPYEQMIVARIKREEANKRLKELTK